MDGGVPRISFVRRTSDAQFLSRNPAVALTRQPYAYVAGIHCTSFRPTLEPITMTIQLGQFGALSRSYAKHSTREYGLRPPRR